MSAVAKDPVLLAHTQLTRFLESNLKVRTEDAMELKFRASLLRKIEAALPTMNSNFLARCYEAVCGVEFAKPEVIELRKKLQIAIGKNLHLSEYAAPNK